MANYNDGTVSEYSIAAGGLTSIGTIVAGSLPESLVIDPTGHYVYAANHGGNTVSEYQIGTGGALIAIGAIAAGNGPWYITVDASGRYVYVANFSDNAPSHSTASAPAARSRSSVRWRPGVDPTPLTPVSDRTLIGADTGGRFVNAQRPQFCRATILHPMQLGDWRCR